MKVAIVGGGVSGLTALWALQHSPHDAQLFDASPYSGSLTQPAISNVGKRRIRADGGLEVFNPARSR